MAIVGRFFQHPENSYFLFGPRGTGKTTLLKQRFPNALYVDLLAGRAIVKTLHPFMASELGDMFDLNAALDVGVIPLVVDSPNQIEVLDSYSTLYLREEVQFEGLVRNIGNFSRFLEAVSFSHTSILNSSEVARECQVSRKTVEGYLSILEDLLLSFYLPVFSKRAKRILSVHPKFYLFDVGVFRSLRQAGPLDRPEEIQGQALEGLVAQHLRSWIAYRARRNSLFFWRTKAGNEVDFVIYGEDGLWAIEVKNTKVIRGNKLNGLSAFKQDYPTANSAFLYRGSERLVVKNVLCIPCDEFLKDLHPAALPWSL